MFIEISWEGIILNNKETEAQEVIEKAIAENRTISMKTYFLTDYGENLLKLMCSGILNKFGRIDLMEICYSSAKELVINATKANLKRILFIKNGLDIEKEEDYEKGMEQFKANLSEDKIKQFRGDYKKYDLPVTATFYYTKDVLNIKVKNNFPLLPMEEVRIRDKFQKATSFSSLIDFYMEYGDNTEGAGMGITMVGILLDQSGIDKHNFSLYSSNKYRETAAKLEIPLTDNYKSKRAIFEMQKKEKGISSEELRKDFDYNYKQFNKYTTTDTVVEGEP
ncbi:MAG: hypothetical protein KDK36_14230 [Leptospiraceae bacterium]|nr:hypothetical protein [Leptospiraceae bacterium]